MFFGLTLINPRTSGIYVRELGVSWLSLQPHVIWMAIEKEPGVYDWSALDREVRALQAMDLDITMVLSPIINTFGEQRDELVEIVESYPSVMHFLREGPVAELQLYPHDETLPLWIDFVGAAVDRYDGDGSNDMPGLIYEVRNWHFVEEYPIPSIKDSAIYVDLLKVTYEAIKAENPNARVILAGLAGNFAQYFAFAEGFIEDDDAGVMNGIKFSRETLASSAFIRELKAEWEYVVANAAGYFDVFDLHAYIIKESFIEGEIEYVRHAMLENGYSRPIWIIEGGGPFKNYPGKRAENTPADPYFGYGSHKENAEFVVKLHALSAAMGVERQHWGLGLENTEEGYWDGPWCGMALMDGDEGFRKPSYFTFQIMVQKLDSFAGVQDLSTQDARIIAFDVGGRQIYVVWNDSENVILVDLSSVLGEGEVMITHIVTELDESLDPIYVADEIAPTSSVPLSITPVFIEIGQ
jgi:hypothetical protein